MKLKKLKFFGTAKTHDHQDRFKLVEGVFSPAEGADVLLSLINYKIKYHNVQLLNLKGNPEADLRKSEKRIEELKQAKLRVTQLLLQAKERGESLDISSFVHIKSTTKPN